MKKMLIELYCAALAARLLGRTALPAARENWEVFRLSERLRPQTEFYEAERKKLIEELSEDGMQADGTAMISPERTQEYMSRMRELDALEQELPDAAPVKLTLPAGLAAEQMAALRDFVEFLPPEDVL